MKKTNMDTLKLRKLYYFLFLFSLSIVTMLLFDYNMHFLSFTTKNATVICANVISIITLIQLFNLRNQKYNVSNLFVVSCFSCIVMSIICLIQPTEHQLVLYGLWIIWVIIIILFVFKQKSYITHKSRIIDNENGINYTISYKYYSWVALSQIVLYIACFNYLLDLFPQSQFFNSLIGTFSMLTPGTYIINLIYNKTVLGINLNTSKSNKNISDSILPWMLTVNLLLIIGYFIIFLGLPNQLTHVFFLISCAINVIFSIMILTGKFNTINKESL